jgi:hypothetical protein
MLGARLTLQRLAQLPAVHFRDADVEKNEVGALGFRLLDSLLAVISDDELAALRQRAPEEKNVVEVVFDQQDLRLFPSGAYS